MNTDKREVANNEMVEASCHCGNIKLKVQALPENLISCNCSICNRIGALWGHYSPDEVEIISAGKGSKAYRWGDEYVDFYHCESCGLTTHNQLTEKCEQQRLSINFRMVDPKLTNSIAIRHFDGADSWEFLD